MFPQQSLYKDSEWVDVGEWMWENRESYNGLSVLPFSDHTYKQAPFEDCSKETYDVMMQDLTNVDLNFVTEVEDNTDLSGEIACAGGACEIDLSYAQEETEEVSVVHKVNGDEHNTVTRG